MDLFEAIRTTRAMRRLDPDRPVSDADVRTILEAALKGPSGGNSQPVRWLVVRDRALKRGIQEIYQRGWALSRRRYEASSSGPSPAVLGSADHLAAHLHEAPVLIIACGETDGVKRDASVYPAVQNLMLAARGLGLGTTLTTVHLTFEDEVKGLLGIPAEVQTFALVPVGYPLGRWGEAKRRPVEEVTFLDRWGEPYPAPSPAAGGA
ncbi:nitroreductase family protein [Dactylosporangium sp. CA-092794]|uniref:nitroreductase family protein n=1 Tax=Dactylosporangium sp. CA-092794 TaxID=3239929 RepID=UPI003D8F0BBE